MKKFLVLPIALVGAAIFSACGETPVTPESATIALAPSAYTDTVGKLGTRWRIPEAYATDNLGNSYACNYQIKSPSGEEISANGGMVMLSEVGVYTVIYTLAGEIAECVPLTYTYRATKSGEYYAIVVEGEGFTAELGEYNSLPTAGVYSGEEKVEDCIFKIYDPENAETAVVDGGFVPTKRGEYTIVYQVANKNLDAETKSVTVSVTDTKAPVITMADLFGNLTYAQKMRLPEWSVTDASEVTVQSVLTDGNGNVVSVGEDGSFTVGMQGEYVWTISAVDAQGNTSEAQKIFTVNTYDENVKDGLLSDFDEAFYADDPSFVTEGKASIYQSVQADTSVEDGALKLAKGMGVSQIGLYFARLTEIEDETYFYLKIRSDASSIYLSRLTENKLYEMFDISSFGYSYEEKGWQTVWIKPEEIGLTGENSVGVQIVFDGGETCAVYLDEIGYRHNFVKYTIEDNLSLLELYAGEEYSATFTISSKDGDLDSSVLAVSSLDESAGEVIDGTFYAKKTGKVTIKVEYAQDAISLCTRYITLWVGDTILDTIAKTLGENEVVLWDRELYSHTLSELLIAEYNNPCEGDATYPEGWYLMTGKYSRLLRMNNHASGSGFRMTFAKPFTANKGCLKIKVQFDGESHARTILKFWSYNETNVENSMDYSGFVAGAQYIYVPVSKLANENGVVEGLQFAFTTGGWKMIGQITYDPDYVDYRIEENLSTLTLVEGNEYDLTQSISLDGEVIENADLRYTVQEEEYLTIENGKLTAKKHGTTSIAIGYYDEQGVCVYEKVIDVRVNKPIMEQLADSLTGDEVYMWNSALYTYAMSMLAIDKYTSEPISWTLYNTSVKDYACVRMSCANTGSGFKLTFPKERQYLTGCLRIRLIFDSDGQAASTTLKIFRYDETNSENGWSFTGFKGGNKNFVYIPVALLADGNGNIDGLQFAFTTGGWKMFADIMYMPNHSAYEVKENLTSLTLSSGGEYDVSVSATDNLAPMQNANIRYTVTDESVLKIENGKLFTLKSGVTEVKISVYAADDTTLLVEKTVSLTVGKSAMEELVDGLGENELARFDSALYLQTLSALTINKYNNAHANEWEFYKAANCIRYQPNWSGSGATINFVKPMSFTNATGYLKIKLYFDRDGSNGRIINIYKYGETDSTKFVAQYKEEISKGQTEIFVYIPVADLVDENGVLKGIQYTQYNPSGWSYIGAITYVAQLP